MKQFAFVIVCALGALLLTAVQDFPDWGDPNSPASSYLSTHYIEKGIKETKVPNLVTAVLADYRAYDTMFETIVVFVAGIAIVFLLRTQPNSAKKRRPGNHPESSIIIQNASRIMIPMMQIFALYVVAHGHYSPGGGFQGGVILGASLILLAIAFDLETALVKIKERYTIILSAAGAMIFSGIGVICLLLGGNFLDYSKLALIFPALTPVMARYHAILWVEVGVALTVMVAMFSIYADLASGGKLEKGL